MISDQIALELVVHYDRIGWVWNCQKLSIMKRAQLCPWNGIADLQSSSAQSSCLEV
jgi:hypothetical protein